MTHGVIAPPDADSIAEDLPTSSGCSGRFACGEVDADELLVLDAGAIPQAIRPAATFGALDGIAPGDGLNLVAPHDPAGLLAQLQQRLPDTFDVAFLQRGPEAWRLCLTRKVA